ncbi:MAG: hypothetical protein DRH37_05395, partial [Deltaproteobacteria bacterium]
MSDGNISCTVTTHPSTSDDNNYVDIDPADVTVTVNDDDIPGIDINESGGITITEGSTTDSYSIALSSEPTDTVSISIAVGSQLTVTPKSVTFTTSDWFTSTTIVITAVNDYIAEGLHADTITHTTASTDPNYANIVATVTANIVDNDTAGVNIIESDGETAVSENGLSDNYGIVLNSEPTDVVTITFGTDENVGIISTVPITFASGNWNITQTVTITAVDDLIDEGTLHNGIITHTATSDDPNYGGIGVVSITAVITDNDTAGITQPITNTTITEDGATDSYTLVLTSEPADTVTIAFDTGSQIESITAITFDDTDWSEPKTITVTAVDDLIDESTNSGTHIGNITHTVTSNDSHYHSGLLSNVSASITDNDTANIIIDELGGITVEEGGITDTYSIVLDSEPTTTVNISLTVGSQLTVTPNSVNFTTSNWLTPTTIVVTAVDDHIDEESPHQGIITHTATSGDSNYGGIVISNTVVITDNDTSGLNISVLDGDIDAYEGGGPESYEIVLSTLPSDIVTVTFTTITATEISAISNITFTTSNWATTQMVTIMAVEDAIAEGSHTGVITHTVTSNDSGYNNKVTTLSINIIDNDTADVDIQTGGNLEVDENGGSDTYKIKLNTEPTNTVTISFAVGSQITTITPITFTSLNWEVLQTVTVEAVDDDLDEGTHTGTISHEASSSGGFYNSTLVIDDVTANITDNDSTPVITSGQTITVLEGTVAPTMLMTVTASDSDGTPIVNWGITSGSPYFDIDNAGQLSVVTNDNTDLDYETQITYTLQITASDGTNISASEAVTVTLIDVDDTAPTVIANTGITTDEGITVTITTAELDAEDIDTLQSSLIFSVTTSPVNGRLQLSPSTTPITSFTQGDIVSGTVEYVHDGTETTTDTFTFDVQDGSDNDLIGQTFAITITAVDDTPPTVPVNNVLTLDEGGTEIISTAVLSATDTESDDSAITFTITTPPINGDVQLSDTNTNSFTQADILSDTVTYVHDDTETITDTFTFDVQDSNGNSLAGQTFDITVTAVDDTPPTVITNTALTASEGMTTTITISELDADDTETNNNTIVFTTTSVTHGYIQLSGAVGTSVTSFSRGDLATNQVQYVHDGTETTSDSFDFTITDSNANALTGQTFTINVTRQNDPPIAGDDNANTAGTTLIQIPILQNDSDEETNLRNNGTITITTYPMSGTLSNINTSPPNGNISYTPITDTNGIDTFEYEICDDGDRKSGGGGLATPPPLIIKCSRAIVTVTLAVASAEPTIYVAQADDCDGIDSCLRSNDNWKSFVLSKQAGDGELTAVLTHQTLIPGSDTMRLNLYISLQNEDGSPNAEAVLMETAVLLADGSLYPAEISQEPTYLVLAVDASESMDDQLVPLRRAAITLVDGLPDGSNVAVIRYDENIDLLQSFSSDHAAASDALNRIQIEADDTCTYDAAYAAMQALVQTAPNNPNRTIVLISDGVDRDANGNIADTCSDYTQAQTIAYAAANDIAIHIIGSDGVDSLPIAQLATASGGTVNVINDENTALDQALLDSFSSRWIASTTMQPSLGLQRGMALLTLANGATPSPVPVQFISPRNYVVPEEIILPATIDISNFRFNSDRDQFELDVAVSNLDDVELLRVELLDGETNVQAGLSIITEPQFSQRIAIAADGLTGSASSIAHAYALNGSGGMVRDANGDPVEAFYIFQHTPAAPPAALSIHAVTVEDEAAKFNLDGLHLENDPPTMRVQFELENGDGA